MPTNVAVFPFSLQTLDIGILDIFGFEEFQKNEFEQVSFPLKPCECLLIQQVMFPIKTSQYGLREALPLLSSS